MTDREVNELLDAVCAQLQSAEALNTIHACRPNHPLGRDNGFKWRNAEWAASRATGRGVDFIKRMAFQEDNLGA